MRAAILRYGMITLLAIGTLGLFVSCKGKFEPGKMKKYENPEIGFALMIPDNLQAEKKGDNKVVFSAEGFPVVEVVFEKTEDSSGRGSGGSSGMGEVTRKVYAPLRKLTCHCAKAGDYEKVVKEICKSLENTKEAPKNPNVKFEAVKIEGKLKDEEAYKKGLNGLQGGIVKCWKDAVEKDAEFPAGDMNFMVTFGPDGSSKASNISRTFRHDKHEPLTECVKKLFFSVKPEPAEGDVKVEWYMRFKLY